MTKLSDTQRILLATAAQRDSGSLWPLAATLKPGGGTAKAVAALVRTKLAEERATSSVAEIIRQDGDVGYGVFITAAGESAVGIEPADHGDEDQPLPPIASTVVTTGKPLSKVKSVIALLQRDDGATLPELIEATGWLPHTTRAALTGIRKRGHAVTRSKRDGATCYRIEAEA